MGTQGRKGREVCPALKARALRPPRAGSPAPVKLAAKGKKAAVNKQAPLQPVATPKAKAKRTAKKRPAKKQAEIGMPKLESADRIRGQALPE